MKSIIPTSHLGVMTSLASLCLLFTLETQAADASKLPPPSDKKGVTYAADIRPLFEASCFKCHGEEKQKEDLRFDTLKDTLKGGEHGSIITPGKSAESKLVETVAHVSDDPDEWMPPEGKAEPFTAEEVGLIRAWIDQGAK